MKSQHVVFCLVTALINAALVSTLASGSEAALKPLEAKTRMEAACREIGTLRSNIFLTLTEGTPDPAKVAAAKQAFAHANWHCIDVQRALMQVELQFTFLGEDFALND